MSLFHIEVSLRRLIPLLIIGAAPLMMTCEEQGQFSPAGPPARLLLISELAATPNRVTTGGQAVVSGRLVDQNGTPYPGLEVDFSAVRGTIDSLATTTANGGFSATYTAPEEAGSDTVVVTASGRSAAVAIAIVGPSGELSLAVTPGTALANGIDSVRVTATLIGRSGPLNRVPIRFETSAGTFNGQRTLFANTDTDGRAFAQLTAPSSGMTIVATVTASTEMEASPPAPPLTNGKRNRRPAGIDAETSARVTFRGVSVDVTADPPLIPGDGQARSRITARVREDNHQAVPNARVNFSARYGIITASAVTDAAGVAAVDLTAAALPGGEDLVIVRYGPEIADSTVVNYAPAVSRLQLTASPLTFLADGVRGARITAQVFGGTGEPAPQVNVNFTADLGTLSAQRLTTDDEGKASVTLTGPPSTVDRVVVVHAVIDEESAPARTPPLTTQLGRKPVEGAHRAFEPRALRAKQPRIRRTKPQPSYFSADTPSDSITLVALGVNVRLAAEPDSIIARRDASSAIIAEIFETTSGNPVAGDTVYFATSLGSITGSAILGADGRATATLTGGTSTGRAMVTVRYGAGHRDTVYVEMLPAIGSLTATADRPYLLAGGIDSAQVRVAVRDALGGAAAGVPVDYHLSHRPGESFRLITAADGSAEFTVISPPMERDSSVTAIVNAGGLERTLYLPVKALTRLLSAEPDSLSAGAVSPVTVTVQVFEKTDRRPVSGDTVWFAASGGVIQPFAVLDGAGFGRTSFRVGDAPGEAWVFGRLGTLLPDSLRIVLVEPVAVVNLSAARRSLRGDGLDTTLITARVGNVLDQPAPGVWVQFAAEAGDLSPAAARTDSLGQARAVFTPPAGLNDRMINIAADVEPDGGLSDGRDDLDDHQILRRKLDPNANSSFLFQKRRLINSIQSIKSGEAGLSGTVAPSRRRASEQINRRSAPPFATPADVRDSLAIEVRGVSLQMSVEPRLLRADGRSKAGVNVRLAETTYGSAIARATVRLGATLGAIPAERITGEDGTFTDSLRAGIDAGISRITATYGGIVGRDSLQFVPDLARLSLIVQLEPDAAVAGSDEAVTVQARVLDSGGRPAEGIRVAFSAQDPVTVLVDPREYREVSRWVNTFNIEDIDAAEGAKVKLQIRGVGDPGTRIYLNRTPLEQIALPRGSLWGETSLVLPAEQLIEGVNRIEIIGAELQGGVDRFSVAGVRLGLSGGHLIGESVSDGDGWAEIEYLPDPTAGVMTLRAALAESPARFAEADLRLTAGPAAAVRIAPAIDTLLATGTQTTDVAVLVADANGNPVGAGLEVNFTADPAGEFDPESGRTLGDGTLTVRYNAPALREDVAVALTAEVGEIRGQWGIQLNGATLDLTADTDRMLADGRAQINIRARVTTSGGRPVAGRRVIFSATSGAVTPEALTAADGVAAATLTASDRPDTAIVTASLSAGIRDSLAVAFVPLVDAVELSAEPASIRADGADSATVTIQVTDGLGAGAAGVRVQLVADQGRLSAEQVVTDAQGRGSVKLFGVASVQDDSIQVTATAGGGASRDTISVRLRGVTIELAADQDSLPANGAATAEAVARVFETASRNPVTNGRVTFAATLGSIAGAADLNDNGVAQARFTASFDSGRAVITARFGAGLAAMDSLTLVDRAAAMEMSLSPESIRADGFSTAAIEVLISDPWGGPAPQERVALNFDGPGSVTPTIGLTGADGIMRATARGAALGTNGRMLITAEARNGRFASSKSLELRGVALDLSAVPPLIAGDGQSTATITAQVRETASGHAVTSDTVYFSTSAGTITRAARLDENGVATASLRSAANPAIAQVVAYFGDRIADTTQVAFAGRFSRLELTAQNGALLADGESQTTLTAAITDTLGRPVQDVAVRFRLLNAAGTLAADSAHTDADGLARVNLISGAAVSDTSAAVEASAENLADTVTVQLRGVTVELSAAPDSLPANGVAVAEITASVRQTTTGNPVVGRTVAFSADRGIITADVTTDDNGLAVARLTASRAPGTAQVTGAFGRTLTATTAVEFIRTVGSLTVEAAERAILADGTEQTVVTATALDQIGNPAAGLRVTFTAPDGGRVTPEAARTNEEGVASVTFTGFAAAVDSTVRVVAVADGGAAGEATVRLVGITTTLSADPRELPANGIATAAIRLTALETVSHNPVSGKTVFFRADRGVVGQSADLDSLGRATVTFTAPAEAGSAQLSARLGDTLTATTTVACIASVPARATITVDPREVDISGVGGDESAVVTVDIVDDRGNVVPDGTALVVRAVPDIGLRFADGLDSAIVTTRGGRATAVVSSGDSAGTARFSVSYNGTVLALGGNLTVRAGPAARVQVRPDLGIVYHPGGGLSAFPVAATVSDRFGNPVADSTQVRFALTPDTAGQVTALGYTRRGVVFHEIQFPLDETDYNQGIWVTYPNDHAGMEVYVRGSAGGARDSTRVIFPGNVQGGPPVWMEVAAEDAELTADGSDSTTITIRLFDEDDQPVADLTEVRLTADEGNVQSPRYTAQGAVTAVYRAGRVAGADTVRIISGEVSDFITFRLIPGPAAQITLQAADGEIRADSIQSTDITAVVRDRFGNLVEAGRVVNFTTTLGRIESQGVTDDQGGATARLTSGLETGTARVTAQSGAATAQIPIRFVSGAAANVTLVSIDRRTIGVRGSGTPETATLVFQVNDDRGVPVDTAHRVWVSFTLDGPARVIDPAESSEDSVAVLIPDSAATDGDGRVTTTLNSGYFAGAVAVTATAAGGAAGEAIAVAIHGGAPDSSHFSLQPLRCVTTGILGTAPDSVTISAALGDRYSNPVVPGTVVRFAATGGVIQGSARTDSLGFCAVILNTVRPWPVEGLDTITAQTVDWRDQSITAQTMVIVSGPTRIAFDADDDWEVPFGGVQNLTVTIADSFGNPLAPGTQISFSLNARTPQGNQAEGVILTGDGTDEPIEFGDCPTQRQFALRVFNYQTGLEGATIEVTASVTSPNGDGEAVSSGHALGQVLSTTDSRVSLSNNQIPADGTTAATVTVTLYDTLGLAVAGVPADAVAISAVGGNAAVTQPSEPSDDQGRVTGSVVGNAVGSATIQVRVRGQLLDTQPQISFIPGPPARLIVTVLDRQLVVGGDTTTVWVNVTDASGNAVNDATIVEFSAPDGSFQPASLNTSGGRAVSLFSSGTVAGAASLTARASGGGASVESTVDNLTFLPGPISVIAVTAPNYSVQVGSQTTLTISASDAFGNAAAENTEIALAVDPAGRGSVAPESVLTGEGGSAEATYTAGTTAGQTARVRATSGDAAGQSSPFTFVAGPPGRITLSAEPEQLVVGLNSTLTAVVVDAFNNAVSDTTRLTFSLNPAVGTVNPSAVNTQNGEATAVISGVTAAGDVEATATASGTAGSVRVTFSPDELAAIRVVAVPTEVVVGRSSTITATATDRFGNPVSGEQLNLAITTNPGGNCTLQHNNRVTAADGTAQTIFTAGQTAGSAIITVTWDEDANIEGSVFVDVIVQ